MFYVRTSYKIILYSVFYDHKESKKCKSYGIHSAERKSHDLLTTRKRRDPEWEVSQTSRVPFQTSAHSNAPASIFYCGHSSCKFPKILRQCNPRTTAATTMTTPPDTSSRARTFAIEEKRLLLHVIFLLLHLLSDYRFYECD